ncbi:ABC transporter ATP-binding protein [Elusimicrobiota bacterium]
MLPIISVRNLKTIFSTEEGVVHAVNGISYDLLPSQTLGIVGESGCGKSVHALSMLGLIPDPPGKVTGGEILFHDRNTQKSVDLLKLSGRKLRQIRGARIAMIFQEPMTSLNPVINIGEQIAEAIRYHKSMGSGNCLHKTAELLEKVGIPNAAKRLNDYPHQFSGGMRQRVMIAMAMAMNPSVLIADEPTTALDVTIQAQILKLISDMQKKNHMALILITHNMGVVAETADEIIVMYAGKIAEKGSAEDIFDKPKHPYTQGLLNSIPKLQSKSDRLVPIEGQPPVLTDEIVGCPYSPRCKSARKICLEQLPPLIKCDKQIVSCWLYAETRRAGR